MFVFQHASKQAETQPYDQRMRIQIYQRLVSIINDKRKTFTEKKLELTRYFQLELKKGHDRALAGDVLAGMRATRQNWGRATEYDLLFEPGKTGLAGAYFKRWKSAYERGDNAALSALEGERRLLFHAISFARAPWINRELRIDHSDRSISRMSGAYSLHFNDCMDYAQKLDAFLFSQVAPSGVVYFRGEKMPLCLAARKGSTKKKVFMYGKSIGWRFTSRNSEGFIAQDSDIPMSVIQLSQAMSGIASFERRPYALVYRTTYAKSIQELSSHIQTGDLVFVMRSPNRSGRGAHPSGHVGIVGTTNDGKMVLYDQNASGVWKIQDFCRNVLKRDHSTFNRIVKIYRPVTSIWCGPFAHNSAEMHLPESMPKERENSISRIPPESIPKTADEAANDVRAISSSGASKAEIADELAGKANIAAKKGKWAIYHVYNNAAETLGRESRASGNRVSNRAAPSQEIHPALKKRKYGASFKAQTAETAERDVSEMKSSGMGKQARLAELQQKRAWAKQATKKSKKYWAIWHIYNNAIGKIDKSQMHSDLLEMVPSKNEQFLFPKSDGTA